MKSRPILVYITFLMIFQLVLPNRITSAVAASIPAILYVAPAGDCAGFTPCYSHPQAAVDAAQTGSVIRIATGNYTIPVGMSQVLLITKSLILQGGFRTTDWYDPQPFTFPTVFDAQHLGRTILIDGNPGQPIEVTLDGIQIKNGQSSQGAGVSGAGVQLSMQRCVISNNQASGSGGGIYLSNSSSLILISSRVISNTAAETGGGITLNSANGNSSMTRSWIFGNSASVEGGGISVTGGHLKVEISLLADNAVTQTGATGTGLAANSAQITLDHVTLARNTGGTGEGVSLNGDSTLMATNILAAGQASAFSITAPSSGTVDGVLWGGGSTWANGTNTTGSGSVTVQHAYTGDPLFIGLDPVNLNTYFHIAETSPARDRSILTTSDYRDIDNESVSVYETVADLGADEFIRYATSGSHIHVHVEPGGDIEVGTPDGTPENHRGAFFWNGSKWVTNDTYAHIVFTDIQTQDRLMNYTMVADLIGSAEVGKYHVSHSTYTYLSPANEGSSYRITAAQYRITNTDTQEIILLNSRGNGYGKASFDIYIQYIPNSTIAFRSGSVWFNYAESVDQAAQHALNDETGRAGILTTCDNQVIDRSRYWMDIDGGSDMGGITYFFHTSNLPTRTTVLGTCFPDEFRVKYMSTTGNLEEFRLRPVVYSETLLLPIYLPLVVR